MTTVAAATDPSAPRLLDRVRDRIRLKHYSIQTEQAYVDRIKRFILFHGKRHPAALGGADVEAFLTDLAVSRRVAAATQNQAKSALLFLYREVIGQELPWLEHVERARTPTRVPVVLTRDEVARLLRRPPGIHRLLGRLLYGSGMRIMEGVRLRIKDVDFSRRQIVVRDGKGGKDRTTMLPASVAPELRADIDTIREIHCTDLADGFGATWLPTRCATRSPRTCSRRDTTSARCRNCSGTPTSARP